MSLSPRSTLFANPDIFVSGASETEYGLSVLRHNGSLILDNILSKIFLVLCTVVNSPRFTVPDRP